MRVRARTHFRDFDGVARQVTKFAASKAAAERALKLALRDRSAPGQLGHLRDPSNTAGDLREVLDGIGCQRCHGRGWFRHR